MKKILLLLVFGISVARAQQPSFKYSDADFGAMRAMEMRAYRLSGEGILDSALYTASSNNFDVRYYRCEWTVDPAIKYITGRVTSYFSITSSTNTISFDLSRNLIADSVLYRGSKIPFTQTDNNGLTITFPSILNAGSLDSLSVCYQGIPDTGGFGSFYQGTHAGTPVIWSLSEPYGARDWWPCKNSPGDKADSIDILITCPSAYTASSNGVRIKELISGGSKTTVFHHSYPIASYLVAMAVTNYIKDTDSVLIGSSYMPLYLYSYPEGRTRYLKTIKDVKKSIQKYSELFGPYPFSREHYSETQFGWSGGMEHQTNSFIGSTWNQLVCHELGHHWFGDKVTCGSWADIWLNEGFANYLQFIYVQNFDTALKVAHLIYYRDLITSEPDGSVYVRDTTDPNRVFSDRLTYSKGGYVVHMLRWVLGDSTFFRGLRRYLNDPKLAYGYAKTADLQRNLEEESGKDLSTFFQQWIYGEGYPDYNAEWKQNINKWISLTLKQTTTDPSVSFYEMPVPLKFIGAGRDTTIVVTHQFSGQLFSFNPGFIIDSVAIDPDLWILSKNKTAVKIEQANQNLNTLSIFPNPAPSTLNISVSNPVDKKLSIVLYASSGQRVYQKTIEMPGYDQLITVPMNQFPKGIYWLKVFSERSIHRVQKIVH